MSSSSLLTRRGFLKASLASGSYVAIGTAGSAILTACGGAGNEKVTLKLWDEYVTQGPWMDNEIKLFHQNNPNITIKRTTNDYSKYADLFNLAEKGKNAPDVFMIPASPGFEDQVKQKWLLPISDFSDFKNFKDTFPNPALDFFVDSNISRATGKTYSAPFGGHEMNIGLWINTKVFKDAGLVDSKGKAIIPQTLDDMLQAARTIKKQSKGAVYGYGFGAKLPYQDIWLIDLITNLSSNGSLGGLNYKTGKYDFADNPIYKEAIEWLATMKKEEHIIPDTSSVDDEGIRFLFSQHKFGMLLAGVWVINGWQQTSPNFTEYAMDHGPLIGTSTLKGAYYTGPGGTNFGISAQTKYKDAAWSFFKWLYSKEAGQRWVKAGNGTSIFPDANKEEYAQNDAMKSFFRICKTMVKISPQTNVRNPDVAQVKPQAVAPSESDIVRGAFTGQITDIAGALKELQDQKQKNLEQAIADANAAGAHVSLNDYIFADWDPTKDYITKSSK